jgi:hypothetical protein
MMAVAFPMPKPISIVTARYLEDVGVVDDRLLEGKAPACGMYRVVALLRLGHAPRPKDEGMHPAEVYGVFTFARVHLAPILPQLGGANNTPAVPDSFSARHCTYRTSREITVKTWVDPDAERLAPAGTRQD